ncbi:hypothetical protein [Coleofasciculus sp. F4-SAH-05]|uniref:hypothetical protein n=1 Tax=Coleofasciculus sp. F4-SAH-05 TaxID=3069525 RepID=UPI0033028145
MTSIPEISPAIFYLLVETTTQDPLTIVHRTISESISCFIQGSYILCPQALSSGVAYPTVWMRWLPLHKIYPKLPQAWTSLELTSCFTLAVTALNQSTG